MAPSTTTSSLLPQWWIAPHTMTDEPRFPSLVWAQASAPSLAYSAPGPNCHCGIGRTGTYHCLRSHTLFLLPHSRQRHLCSKVSLGHEAGRRDQYPVATSRLRMVRIDICLPNRRIICIRRRGAEMKRFVLIIWSNWRSSRGGEIFIQPPCFLGCGRPVSQLHSKILLMHPWDTPSILTTFRWELQSDNLTIRCSISINSCLNYINISVFIAIFSSFYVILFLELFMLHNQLNCCPFKVWLQRGLHRWQNV